MKISSLKTGTAAFWPQIILGLTALFSAHNALALNGNSLTGNSASTTGMTGAGTAIAIDAAALIRNPAAGVMINSNTVLDIALAGLTAGYTATATASNSQFGIFEFDAGSHTSVDGIFPIPAAAHNWRLSPEWAVGLSLSGAGIASKFETGSATLGRGLPTFESNCEGSFGGGANISLSGSLCGNGSANTALELTQIQAALHISYQATPTLSLGFSPIFALQQLKIKGLDALSDFSVSPDHVTGQGPENSYGTGWRAGFIWQPHPRFSLGASYQNKIEMSALDDYKGALYQGRLDIPAVLNVGIAITPIRNHRLLIDMESVRYANAHGLGTDSSLNNFAGQCLLPRALDTLIPLPAIVSDLLPSGLLNPQADERYCLGGELGPGFGWSDITVYKIGYLGQAGSFQWSMGYSQGGNPTSTGSAILTTLGPGVVDRHAAVGLSWDYSPRLRIVTALTRLLPNVVRQQNAISNIDLQLQGLNLPNTSAERDPDDQWVSNKMQGWQLNLGVVIYSLK